MSDSLSNSRLKNRLLGAALLVILAALLIPLLLGEPKQSTQSMAASQNSEFESKFQPLPDTDISKADPETSIAQNSSEPNGALVLQQTEATPTLEPGAEEVLVPQIKAQAEIQTAKVEDKKTPKLEPVMAQTNTETQKIIKSGWAVQAGIFSKSDNAHSIARILRKKGIESNISSAKASFGKATRVWVGPFTSKAEAQALSKKLEQQTGNGGYVAEYPFKS